MEVGNILDIIAEALAKRFKGDNLKRNERSLICQEGAARFSVRVKQRKPKAAKASKAKKSTAKKVG